MQRSLLRPVRVDAPLRLWSLAVLAKGFRPFFLAAAVFAAIIVPLWLFVLNSTIEPTRYLAASIWHAHEMIFGFVTAVIAGFLLTAVSNWTGRDTAVGSSLLFLAALWLAGRAAIALSGVLPRGVPALLDLAFLPALIGALGRPLFAAKNRRNFVMLAILVALLLANTAVHLDALGFLPPGSARRATLASIDVVLLVILILSGRVFPMFTRNASGAQSIRSMPRLDAACIAAMVVLTAVSVSLPGSKVSGALAVVVGVLAAVRAIHWGTRHSLGQPLLWILHGGYVWLVVGLLLRGLAVLGGALPESVATHALTVGAIGSLTLGMMARVSLGHTGRPIAASAPLIGAFVTVNFAAAVRTFGPLLLPAHYFGCLIVAGALWTATFIAFVVVFGKVLLRPRVDGRPG